MEFFYSFFSHALSKFSVNLSVTCNDPSVELHLPIFCRDKHIQPYLDIFILLILWLCYMTEASTCRFLVQLSKRFTSSPKQVSDPQFFFYVWNFEKVSMNLLCSSSQTHMGTTTATNTNFLNSLIYWVLDWSKWKTELIRTVSIC